MPVRSVKLTGTAQISLRLLRENVKKRFGESAWAQTNQRLRRTIDTLRQYPLSGTAVQEVEQLGGLGYRQAISGMNRVIYKVDDETIYVAYIMGSRQDLQKLVDTLVLMT
ncbi:MAG: type II toxin-antitoxin system RelE/ParE family toxin [Trinickia sp.]|uniref:type II toxin-antitoxin system RelE/ParE family toxin n=1 Tax=Trinickia sp. TaxID=2571163 RepID=UPI003F81C5DB